MKKSSERGSDLLYLFKRRGTFQYRRVIPAELRILAGQSEFKESLRTDLLGIAVERYVEVHRKYETAFEQLLDGRAPSKVSGATLPVLRTITDRYHLPYRSAVELIAAGDTEDLNKRMVLWEREGRPTDARFAALFGAETNQTSITEALTFYETQRRDQIYGLSKREAAKKRNPERAVIKNFVSVVGDLPLSKIDRHVVNAYRNYLLDLIQEWNEGDGSAGIGPPTANKRLMHLGKIMSYSIKNMGLEIKNPFSGTRFNEEVKKRPPYSTEFLKTTWLNGSPFATLNREAQGVLFAMINTGCGAKEICGLDEEDICLNHSVPHIKLRHNKHRRLKTNDRGRDIPLVGPSLKAMQDNPLGFPKYRKSVGSDTLSATVIKYLRAHKLLETEDHTVYNLRHTFKDRMRKHKFPEELQNYLMGHKHPTIGAHYGKGFELPQILEYMTLLGSDLS